MNETRKISLPIYGDIRVVGHPEPTEFCLVDVCESINIDIKEAEKWISDEHVRTILAKDRTGRRACPVRFINSDGLDDIVNGSGLQSAKNLKYTLTPPIEKHRASIIVELEAIYKIIEDLKEENAKLKALADSNVSYEGIYTTTQIAKEFGYSASVLNGMLKIVGVQYFKSGVWILKAPYSQWGLTILRTGKYEREDGNPCSSKLTVWTEKGRRFLKVLQKNGFDTKKAVNSLRKEFNL